MKGFFKEALRSSKRMLTGRADSHRCSCGPDIERFKSSSGICSNIRSFHAAPRAAEPRPSGHSPHQRLRDSPPASSCRSLKASQALHADVLLPTTTPGDVSFPKSLKCGIFQARFRQDFELAVRILL